MIIFNENNIFDEKKSTGFLASKTKIIPFQLAIIKTGSSSVISVFKIINGTKEIDLSSDISKIILYESQKYFYHLFFGKTILSTNVQPGKWQIYLEISHDLGTYIYFSNFFNIICDEKIKGRLEYWNSKDFENVIFQDNFRQIIYFSTFLKNENSYKKEKIIEQGDGTQLFESQIIANGYSFIIRGDNFSVERIQKIGFFDNAEIFHNYLDAVPIFQRIETEENFNEKNYNYSIKILFYIKNIDKNLCLSNKEVQTKKWILSNGTWKDTGIWDDSDVWID